MFFIVTLLTLTLARLSKLSSTKMLSNTKPQKLFLTYFQNVNKILYFFFSHPMLQISQLLWKGEDTISFLIFNYILKLNCMLSLYCRLCQHSNQEFRSTHCETALFPSDLPQEHHSEVRCTHLLQQLWNYYMIKINVFSRD